MRLHIFIEEDEGSVILDRSFFVVDGKAPVIELQDIVDDAMNYIKDDMVMRDEQIINEARRLTQHTD